MATASAVSSDLVARFERDGHVIARQVIDQGLVEEGREHVAWLTRRHPDVRPEHLGHTLVGSDPFWVRLISDPRLLDVAQQFIGPDIALFASHYIAKPPRDGQAVLWHQDGSYWPLDPMRVVTLWLALDDATPENGCMRVVPGTQHSALEEMKPRSEVANVLGSGMDDALVDESRAVDVVLAAGDVSIHHPNLVHGSNANASPRWRRGLTIRYIPTSTRIVSATPWPCAFLLRGRPVAGINTYARRPTYVAGEHLPFRGCERWNEAIGAATA
ncbi:MAG TPA: phytanoyl-CoA dioxygenase family protein [Planctomycetota bacterium]|nr:phytanoyl-CoA dioxygenase family protein [Planctomycetota bacterium]